MSKIKGADFSKWQNVYDWDKLNNSDLKFLILRSSYRKSIDPKFMDFVKNSSIPILGVYHFIYATNVNEASQEAEVCLKAVREAGLNPENVAIFADYEYDSIVDAAAQGITITPEDCRKITEAFLNTIEEKSDYYVGIYCKNWYTKEMFSNEKYILWLADYRDSDPSYPCSFQQYTSSGSVPGVKGFVDLDYCFMADQTWPIIYLADNKEEKSEKVSTNKVILDIFEGKWSNGEERKNKLTEAGYDYDTIQKRVNMLTRSM